MNRIYIGDRQLEPDDEPEVCETCSGHEILVYVTASGNRSHGICPDCQHDSDPGEPNDYPE